MRWVIIIIGIAAWAGTLHAAMASRPEPNEPSSGPRLMRLKPLIVRDSMFQMEAFRLLIPADWRGEGQVYWRLHPQYPAAGGVRAADPNSAAAAWIYPMVPFVDGIRHLPVGASYIGNEFQPAPADPAGYVTRFVLPRARPDIRNYQITATEEMPEWATSSTALAGAAAIGVRGAARAGRVRLAYSLNGLPVQEDFFVLLVSVPILGLNYWGAEWALSARAEPGRLDEVRKILQTMMTSIRVDLHWYSRERQVASMVEDSIYRQQQQIMELSRYLARTNDQITESIRGAYRHRQEVMDRCNARFDQYIRGVEGYRNPYENRPVELPSGYSHVWVNAAGEYVLSDDPNYNPNVGSTTQWREAPRNR